MRVFWVLLALSGCVRSASVQCGDRICPTGTQCDEIHDACITAEQVMACAGLAELAGCDPGDGEIAFCHDGVCLPATCGDRRVEGSEQCDRDVLPKTDCMALGYYQSGAVTCRDDCTYDVTACGGICGDGVREMAHEACDRTDIDLTDCTEIGYYFSGPVSCNQLCQYDASQCTGFCGDGVVNDASEVCDGSPPAVATCTTYGFDAGAIGCSQFCTPGFASCAHFGFEQVASSGTNNVEALYMASESRAYALDTDGKLLTWNAGTWSGPQALPGDTLYYGIGGSSPSNVFAVGLGGTIARFDGTSWTAMSNVDDRDLHAVTVTSATHAWAVGEEGAVLHWNGSDWTVVTIPAVTTGLFDVWAAAPDDVFVLGTNTVHHLKGTTWTTTPMQDVTAIHGFSPTSVFVIGMNSTSARFDGSTWQPLTGLPNTLYSDVWGSSPTNLFVVGLTGQAAHFDGNSWGLVRTQTTRGLYAISGVDAGHAITVGQEGLTMVYRGVHWREDPGTSTASSVTSAWGTGASNIYLTMASGFFRFDGKTWSEISVSGASSIERVWGLAPSLLWAVTYTGQVLRWNGSQWSIMAQPASFLRAIWGTADNDLYAVSGELLHFNGSIWATETLPSGWSVYSIWGSGPTDIFVTNQGGEILHKGPAGWSVEHPPSGKPLEAIWGSGPSDVFAVGAAGQILHYDGTSWTPQESGTTTELRSVWGSGPDDVMATGADGLVLHYDGARWAPVRSPTAISLNSVWTTGRTTILAGALAGLLYRFDRTTPWVCSTDEVACGDSVDNDCDGNIDADDGDCATHLRLAEIHGGVGPYVEVINRGTRAANLDGITLTMRGSCNSAPVSYTFMPDSIVQVGGAYRAIARTSSLVAHERPFTSFCDAVSGGGWYALCAGPCDLATCSNVIDYLEVTGSTTPVSAPDCTNVSVSVTGATATQSAVRVGFAGVAADWTLGTATRD
jgi:hypothetical protein